MPQVPENKMSEPLICCIMPTRDRPQLAIRAVRCFSKQSVDLYTSLFIMDSGSTLPDCKDRGVFHLHHPELAAHSVGNLRNCVIGAACFSLKSAVGVTPDYISHFDDDDISAPLRLQRQLEHIQQTGKLVTGFRDMPMYDLKNDKVWIYTNPHPSYSLGNCLFYKREAWERVKFPDMTPEDNLWRKNIGGENIESRSVFEPDGSPLMIQVVHGANASASIIRSSTYYKEPTPEQENAVRKLLVEAG